jgi:uncharacterized DUF497 family protein
VVGPDDFEGFEWDEEKSARCYEDRGFDFAYAAKLSMAISSSGKIDAATGVSHGSSASERSKGGS